MALILHICSTADWRAGEAAGAYTAASLAAEGFIHCSTTDQVLGVANNLYVGQSDLVLLLIDTNALTETVVYDRLLLVDSYGHGAEFPHVYGPINLDAVVDVVAFPAGADGRFTLPAGLAEAD